MLNLTIVINQSTLYTYILYKSLLFDDSIKRNVFHMCQVSLYHQFPCLGVLPQFEIGVK